MDLTFLAPGAAIGAASLAIPGLVALYLLKLRRKPLRVSSTLLWSAAAHDLEANVPLRWLKASWLLLLHILIAALLCLALGRPALSGPPGQGRRTTLLIDCSASMGALDGSQGATRLEEAKLSALEKARHALEADGATVSVVSFASNPTTRCPPTSSLRVVQDALSDIAQSDEPADLRAAGKYVDATADSGEESSSVERPHVILFSDGSFAPDQRASLSGSTFSFVRCGPSMTAERFDNRGVIALAARRDYDDPTRVRLLTRVLNAKSAPRTVVLSLSVNDAVTDRRPITIPGVDQAPTGASTTFDLALPLGGVLQVSLDEPDLLLSDNSAAVVVAPAARPRITLVRPDSGTSEPQSASDFLLADALSELAPGAFSLLSSTEYTRREEARTLTPGELYVFDRTAPLRAPPGPSLSFGAPLPSLGITLVPAQAGGGTYVLSWLRTHPMLRDVALDSIFITQPLVPSSPVTESRPRITDLATGTSGPLIQLFEDGQRRRVLVCFELDRSNWPLQISFPIFLAAAADFLTLRAEASVGIAFKTGTPFEIRAPGASAGQTIEFRGPSAFSLIVPSRADGMMSVRPVERAGVYEMAPDMGDRCVAVNLLDPTESALNTTDQPPVTVSTSRVGVASPVKRELWRPLIFLASALLILEWILYARRAAV